MNIYILEDLCYYVCLFLKIPLLDLTKLLGMEETHLEMVLCQVACLEEKKKKKRRISLSVCMFVPSFRPMIGFDPT